MCASAPKELTNKSRVSSTSERSEDLFATHPDMLERIKRQSSISTRAWACAGHDHRNRN